MHKGKKRMMAVFLASVAALSILLGACAEKKNKENSGESSVESMSQSMASSMDSSAITESSTPAESSKTPVENQNEEYIGALDALSAEKLASLTIPDGAHISTVGQEGLVYQDESGKYGLVSIEGHDTGALYNYCRSLDFGYFSVSSSEPSETNGVESMNCMGIVDIDGTMIVPEEYATFSVLNDRYIKASVATEETDSEEDALIYTSNTWIALGPEEGDTLYKGTWCVYDTETKTKVPNASGTKGVSVSARGNWLTYRNDNEEQFTVDNQGNSLSEKATLFNDGSYALPTDSGGDVYDANGSLLFSYPADGFIPRSIPRNGWYMASKYVNGETAYVLLDQTGAVISAEFTGYLTSYGSELVATDDKMYDLSGKEMWTQLIASTNPIDSVRVDDAFENCWSVRSGDTYKFVTRDGSVLCEASSAEENTNIYSSDFCVSKEVDDIYYFYCYKDQDYTIPGESSVGAFTIQAEGKNGTDCIVDTVSGNTLIEGYSQFHKADMESGYLIYASKDNSVDVYRIQQGS